MPNNIHHITPQAAGNMTRRDLKKMYNAKSIVGSFSDTDDYYWSSSVEKKQIAWYQDFGDGSQSYGGKNFKLCVRAVRAF